MSDHAWVQEHVAAYLAGGLDAQEAERLETHTRDCPACAEALTRARQLDDGLSALFTDARPAFGMEDRVIARLRPATPSRPVRAPRAKWAGAIAAVLLLGVIGAVAGSLASGEGLWVVPRESATAERTGEAYFRRSGKASPRPTQTDLTNDDLGLDSNIEAALPQIEKLGKQTVDEKVTTDGVGQPNVMENDIIPGETAPGRWATATRPNATGSFLKGEGGSDGTANPAAGGRLDAKRWYGYGGATGSTTGDRYDRRVDGGSKWENRAYKGYAPVPVPSRFDPTAGRLGFSDQVPAPNKPVPTFASGPDPTTAQPKAPAADPKTPDATPDPSRRIVLRSGDIAFEVESFDAATATVTKLVLGTKGAFVSTVNSDKLPNGKVKGSVTVRVPPEHLDGLVLDLRRELGKGGELKSVKLTSEDVTKAYTDIESRLRGARTMEQRLLQIIKEGKGEIKQLLEAEKELGVWRTRIEEFEGEIRYYAARAALSTLTVTVTEKEIRAAAAVTERERVQAGVEVEDVDKAYQQLIAAVVEAKGRIAKSEMKQLAAGQFNAAFQFEVAAEAGGPLRDRLRMLGRVARLEIDRTVQTEGGTLPSDAKTKRGDTLFLVQLYNLANVAPRETATLQIAAPDVPAAYQALRDAVAKTTGRVLAAQLNEQDRQNVSAQLDFEARRTDEGAVRAALGAAGDVLARQVTRAPETDSVTDTKVLYRVTLHSADRLRPRETVTLAIEVADVDGTAARFAAQVAEAKGRQVDAKFDRDRGQVTAQFVFEVPLAAAGTLAERFQSAGAVRVSQTVSDPQAPAGRYATARLHVTLTNVAAIVPDGGGLWPKVRQGLTISASVLLTSVTWLVFGLCVVLPWAVLGFGGYRVVRRITRPVVPLAPAPVTHDGPSPAPTAPPSGRG